MNLDIRIDIARARSAAIGKEHGITPGELKAIEPRVNAAHRILRKEREEGAYGFWDLHKDRAVLNDVKETALDKASQGIDNLVVMGIGGSALGITTLATALKPRHHNLMTRRGRKGAPRLFVMDNIDPVSFQETLRLCPPRKTLYNVISKSGTTAETISQLMIVLEMVEKKLGKAGVQDRVVVTTNPPSKGASPSVLESVSDTYGTKRFTIPLNVGGRFSVFSPVGLFPAAVLGMDVDAMMDGCRAMDKRCAKASLSENPAYLRAAVQYLADSLKGKTMSVMMPYADSLRDLADWYRQIWAESLGKQHSLDGETVFAGQTPIKALGVTDQHSQIQLYREGPNDKLINIVEVRRFNKTMRIPNVLDSMKSLDYLRGKTMNKLMAAELRGTLDALRISDRPVSRIVLPRVNAHTIAQLLYMLEVETAMAGRLYNVQTFDQPGVEEGKRIARLLMGG